MDELPERLTQLTEEECHQILEEIRWNGIPTCPYCESQKSRRLKNEQRYQCNECFTSYSVTVGTIFHKTHISLKVWFLIIFFVLNQEKILSCRSLSNKLKINKNTASKIKKKIQKSDSKNKEILSQIQTKLRSISNNA